MFRKVKYVVLSVGCLLALAACGHKTDLKLPSLQTASLAVLDANLTDESNVSGF